MAINVSLATLATLNNTSILEQMNANFSTIQTALTGCLALSGIGTSPNQMQSNLDMNNNQIFNLPAPATINSPARLADVATNPTITVPPVGTSGGTVPLLNTNVTWSGTTTFNAATTWSGSINPQAVFLGSSSGQTTFATTSTGGLEMFTTTGAITITCNAGFGSGLQLNGGTSGNSSIAVSPTGQLSLISPAPIQFGNSSSFSANGSVATALTSLGPTGSHTTVQAWLTIEDNNGVTRYIPCF